MGEHEPESSDEIQRRRGMALSSYGRERFFVARECHGDGPPARRPTLAECAARAGVGLRTLTRCLRGERVDRRSLELIFLGLGLELGADDVA
jgi:hypothetical protein